MWIIIAGVITLQLAPFAFLSLAFRPHPNGAEIGGVRLTEWPAPTERPEPEYA